jgi:hypothetical protein
VPHTVLLCGIGELVKLKAVVKYEVKYYYTNHSRIHGNSKLLRTKVILTSVPRAMIYFITDSHRENLVLILDIYFD